MNRTLAWERQYEKAWDGKIRRTSPFWWLSPTYYNWGLPNNACGDLSPMSCIVGVTTFGTQYLDLSFLRSIRPRFPFQFTNMLSCPTWLDDLDGVREVIEVGDFPVVFGIMFLGGIFIALALPIFMGFRTWFL